MALICGLLWDKIDKNILLRAFKTWQKFQQALTGFAAWLCIAALVIATDPLSDILQHFGPVVFVVQNIVDFNNTGASSNSSRVIGF